MWLDVDCFWFMITTYDFSFLFFLSSFLFLVALDDMAAIYSPTRNRICTVYRTCNL